MSSYLTGDPLGREGVERIYRFVAGDDPAAGAEIAVTVPAGKLWELRGLLIQLVTDATVATRHMRLAIDDGNTVGWRTIAPSSQTASLTVDYSAYPGRARFTNLGNVVGFELPDPPLILFPGHRIRTTTDSLQAGDNYAAPVLYVCEVELRGLAAQLGYEAREARGE